MIIYFICTIEPATGKTMVRPACELYRTIDQAIAQVMSREYEKGIATWISGVRIPDTALHHFTPIADIF